MRAKLITIFFITFGLFAGAMIWRVDQALFGDKLNWSEAQSRSQISVVVQSIEQSLQHLSGMISLSYPEIENAKTDFSVSKPYSQFHMVAKLTPPSSKDDKKDWQFVSQFYQEKSNVKSWAATYISMALKTVKESDVKMGSTYLFTLMDPSRKPFLLMLNHSVSGWYVGLVSPQIFQGMMDRQKGQLSSLYVVNLQGQALAHTTPEYVGSLLTEDPLVVEATRSSVSNGSGQFRDLKGEMVQGFYEQVSGSNIYAVITTPIAGLSKNRDQLRLQLLMMGIGLCMVGMAIFIFVYKPESAPAVMLAPQAPVGPQVIQAPATQDKADYLKVASALSHELKFPLTSILGHAQLAIQNLNSGLAQPHLEKIETEARSAREIIQKLLMYTGEDKFPTTQGALETVLTRSLKNVEGKILSKGIRLIKNIQSVPPFSMSTDLVVKAVENILLNSIEAMDRVSKKELSVNLKSEGNQIFLSIADSGEGIAPENLSKIFDPFYTTRSGGQHVGLGLSTAMGIFKQTYGEIQVQSEKGKGTTFEIRFTPQESLLTAASPKVEIRSAPLAPPVAPKADPKPAANPPPVATAGGSLDDKLRQAWATRKVEDELTTDISPLIADKSIEKLIDDVDGDLEITKDINFALPATEPIVEAIQADVATVAAPVVAPEATPAKGGFSAKIDKPNIEFKKKTSKLDDFVVNVPKPGARL